MHVHFCGSGKPMSSSGAADLIDKVTGNPLGRAYLRHEIQKSAQTELMIGLFGQGETFGEAYAALPGRSLLASAIAAEPSTVLFTEVRHIVSRCPKECSYHAQVNANLLASIARKNLYLSQRILDSAPKSIRGKLLAYLSTQSKAAGTREFDIPFSRQQLADYLGVDRSALSSVISELLRDKVLRSQRSHFELL